MKGNDFIILGEIELTSKLHMNFVLCPEELNELVGLWTEILYSPRPHDSIVILQQYS